MKLELARHGMPEALGQQLVAVQALEIHQLRQLTGGGRLARTHEADQDVGQPIRSRYAATASRTSSMWSPPNFAR